MLIHSIPVQGQSAPSEFSAAALRVDGGPPHLGVGVKGNFSILAEQPGNLVHMLMGGFYGADDIEAFQRALETTLATLTCPANQHIVLCDVRAMKIQTQDTVAAFSRMMARPALRSRRLAFVTGSSLARMQTSRLTDREGVAFFDDPAPARAWLAAG